MALHSEEIEDEVYEKMVEFLEDHEVYKLIEILAGAIATKEQK